MQYYVPIFTMFTAIFTEAMLSRAFRLKCVHYFIHKISTNSAVIRTLLKLYIFAILHSMQSKTPSFFNPNLAIFAF